MTKKRRPPTKITHIQNLWDLHPLPRFFMDRKGRIYRWQQNGTVLVRRRWLRYKGAVVMNLSYGGSRGSLTYSFAKLFRDQHGTPVHWTGKTILPGHAPIPPDAPGY